MKSVAILLAVTGTLVARGAEAQPAEAGAVQNPPAAPVMSEPETRCKAAAEARMATRQMERSQPASWCKALAGAAVTSLIEPRADRTALATTAAQPTITDTPAALGTAGQTAAVGSGQPVAVAGGSVAAVGEVGSGLAMVTALAINPIMIATDETEVTSLWASRTLDLAIVLPINVDPAEGLEKGFQYIGGRLRANVFPLIEQRGLRTKVEVAYATANEALGDALVRATGLIEQSSNPEACAAAIESADSARQEQMCGASIATALLSERNAKARAALGEFREQADRKYLSLEARFDRGDLNGDAADAKDTLFASYLSAGYNVWPDPDGVNISLSGRGGMAFYKDGLMDESQYAYSFVIGIELEVVRDLRRYGVSAGFELNKRIGDDKGIETDLENTLRIGLALPVADGKTLSVGIEVPTDGGDPTLAMSGDWSLLLGR